jgi:hypothetical protein
LYEQNGYTTEKLFDTLALDILPVYYGALDAPNVTVLPSFVRASDFSSPTKLAQHLLFLDGNNEAYEAYFTWKRTSPDVAFDPKYLDLLAKQWAGPLEHRLTREQGIHNVRRAAACCRLCNKEFVSNAPEFRPVPRYWTRAEIQKVFYGK